MAKKKFFVNKNFCQRKNFYSENFLSPKIFDSENVLSAKFFADFGQEKKYVNENFWLTIFLSSKILSQKNYGWRKNFGQ